VKKLTPSKEHYIKEVSALSSENEGARISDIAERLSVSKASVCAAMDCLQKLKLVDRDSNRRVLLTKEGGRQAVLIAGRFAVIKKFLTEALHVSEKTANADTCALAHVISDATLFRMNGYIESLINKKVKL